MVGRQWRSGVGNCNIVTYHREDIRWVAVNVWFIGYIEGTCSRVGREMRFVSLSRFVVGEMMFAVVSKGASA